MLMDSLSLERVLHRRPSSASLAIAVASARSFVAPLPALRNRRIADDGPPPPSAPSPSSPDAPRRASAVARADRPRSVASQRGHPRWLSPGADCYGMA